jgi:hypothetical protein
MFLTALRPYILRRPPQRGLFLPRNARPRHARQEEVVPPNFFLVRVPPLQATGLAEAEEPVKGLRCAAMNAIEPRP